MEVISLPRRGGKTLRMLQWMAAQPAAEERVCVTFTAEEADRLRRMARDHGLDVEDWKFVSAREIARGALEGRPRVTLGVDNAEMVLSALLGYRVGALSATPE